MATPPPIRDPMNSQRWLEWFRLISQELQDLTTVNWSDIVFTGSNLTDLATRNHNQLQNIDGGTTDQYYHLTSAQHTGLTGGGNADAYHTHSGGGGGGGDYNIDGGASDSVYTPEQSIDGGASA